MAINKNNNHEEIIEPLEVDVLGLPKKKVQHIAYKQEIEYSNYQGIIPFLFMCFFTGGLYQLYFFYKSWKYIDNGENTRFSPAFKSMFYFVFNFSLVESYLILSKKTSLLFSLLFYLMVLLNISFNVLNIVDKDISIFSILSFIVLIPFLLLRNYYFKKVQENLKRRKWISKGDIRFLAWFWLIVLALMILYIFNY